MCEWTCVAVCCLVCGLVEVCVRLRVRLCDPCVCVVGMLCVFRRVDRWDLAILALVEASKRLSRFCYSQPSKPSGCREKEEKHFLSYIRFWPFSIRLSPQTPRPIPLLNVQMIELGCSDPFVELSMATWCCCSLMRGTMFDCARRCRYACL